MLAIGVSYEYLSIVISGYDVYYVLHSVGIQFVKDVIEQQYGRGGMFFQ
jgi:hypothetical protein